jgi:hypothetical protein
MIREMDHRGHSQGVEAEAQELLAAMHLQSPEVLEELGLHIASVAHRSIMQEAEAAACKTSVKEEMWVSEVMVEAVMVG